MCGGQLSSFPHAPCVRAVDGDPKGLFLSPVQRTVRRGAHAPTGLRIPVLAPLTWNRKVSNRFRAVIRTGVHHLNTRAREKNPKKIRNRWQPIGAPGSLTSRRARRERGAGPYTFLPGRLRPHGTRRGHEEREHTAGRRHPERAFYSFTPGHTSALGFFVSHQARTTHRSCPTRAHRGPERHPCARVGPHPHTLVR